jgi:hypothetical protein
MIITPKSIKVSDIFKSFEDKKDDGVLAYGGKLSVRPPYQREFVYNSEQAEAVIHTILKGFPLNVMYWVKVVCYIIDTDEKEWLTYRRDSAESWLRLMGEAWEPVFYCEKIEKEYQHYLATSSNSSTY